MVSVTSTMPNFETGGERGGQQELPPQHDQPPSQQQQQQQPQAPIHNQNPPPRSMNMLGTGMTRSKLTPYDSLKELVKKKRQLVVQGGGVTVGGGSVAGGVSVVGSEEGLPPALPPPPVIATHAQHATTHQHGYTSNNIIQASHQQQQYHHGTGGGNGLGPPPFKNRKIDHDGMSPLVATTAASASSLSVSNRHHHQHHDDSSNLFQDQQAHAGHTLKHSVSAPIFKPSNFLRQALYPSKSSKQNLMARRTSLSTFDLFSNSDNSNTSYYNDTFSGESRLQRILEYNDSGGDGNNTTFLNNGFNLKSLPDRLQQQHQHHPPESALHRACCRGDGVAIRRHLQQHSFDAGNASQLKTLKKRYNAMFRVIETRRLPERYTFPINLAIHHGASSDALRELARLAPQALTTPDGPNREISIHILLSHLPSVSQQDLLAMVDLILLKYPMVAKAKDRLLNLPLHVACRHGCPLDVVRHVCIMYPDALFWRNFHGLTPMDLAHRADSANCRRRRSSSSSSSDEEAVVNYLWEAVAEQTEPMLLDQPQPMEVDSQP